MNVKQFKTTRSIVDFVSPVGNSGVPYPWAIDEGGFYYLMLHDVKIHFKNKLGKMEDAYGPYYEIGGYDKCKSKGRIDKCSKYRTKCIHKRLI